MTKFTEDTLQIVDVSSNFGKFLVCLFRKGLLLINHAVHHQIHKKRLLILWVQLLDVAFIIWLAKHKHLTVTNVLNDIFNGTSLICPFQTLL